MDIVIADNTPDYVAVPHLCTGSRVFVVNVKAFRDALRPYLADCDPGDEDGQ
jgi:hypothetical protein